MSVRGSSPYVSFGEALKIEKIALQTSTKANKTTKEEPVSKADRESQLEGNQKLNKARKMQFKKEKKQQNRRDKVAQQLAAGLDNFTISGKSSEDYDFKVDFEMNT